jgi:hypothetical protein
MPSVSTKENGESMVLGLVKHKGQPTSDLGALRCPPLRSQLPLLRCALHEAHMGDLPGANRTNL